MCYHRSSKEYLQYIDLATDLINIEKYIHIYGIDTIGSNVHNLCHLTNDVKNFGCLDAFSAYPFESYLGYIKSLLRQGNRPLEQVCKRLIEHSNIKSFSSTNESQTPFAKHPKNRNGQKTFDYLDTSLGFVLTNRDGDTWFLTNRDEIVEVLYIKETDKMYICMYIVYGRSIKERKQFFTQPFSSGNLNIYSSSGEKSEAKMYSLEDLKCKLISLEYKQDLVFLTLLHTIR